MRLLQVRAREAKEHLTFHGQAPITARLSTGETLPTRTVVWTAGVAPHPSLRTLSLPLDERGRVPVDEYLRVEGMEHTIYLYEVGKK